MAITTTAAIEDALYTWLVAELGIEVIMARSGKPRASATPYATILVPAPMTTGGYDDAGELTDPNGPPSYGERAMRGDREVAIEVEVLGPLASDYIRQASNSLNKLVARDALAAVGMAPKDNGTITDLTALLETDFEGRALLEVAMVFADSYTDTVPLIEHVTGTGTVDPGSYTVPLQADKP
jgi:hypothetical protein